MGLIMKFMYMQSIIDNVMITFETKVRILILQLFSGDMMVEME